MPRNSGIFAIQEGIIKTVEQAVKVYGLTSLPGSEGDVNVLEDVKEMGKGYKEGMSLEFYSDIELRHGSIMSHERSKQRYSRGCGSYN
jgi:hypothetical protein